METNPNTPKRLLRVGGISVNAHNKAVQFSIFSKCGSFHVSNFWITTVSFWICFFVWFGNLNLLPWITKDDNYGIPLSTAQKSLSATLLTLSTTIFRVIIGDLADKIGSRYCYLLILVCSFIPVCALSFISSPTAYVVLNFFIGIVGASFVITEYHTTQFYVDRLVGLANATAAGWGNFGGGCAAIFMPFLATTVESKYGVNPWRYITFCSSLLLIIPMILYYYFAVDTVNGNLNYQSMVTRKKLLDFSVLWQTVKDSRTWILFAVYMACFGVEITVISFLQEYFRDTYGLSPDRAGLYVFMFSCLNLFARSVGGYGSDILYKKYSIQGRVYILVLTLLAESIFLLIFAFSSFNLGYCVVILLFFSFYVQCAEGITYAIVPFVKIGENKNIGPIYGIVAAGGNAGSVLFASTVFAFTPNVCEQPQLGCERNTISYQTAFIILSMFVGLVAFLSLCIKFTAKEIREADELLMSFLKKHHRAIYGQHEEQHAEQQQTPDTNNNNNSNNNNNNTENAQ